MFRRDFLKGMLAIPFLRWRPRPRRYRPGRYTLDIEILKRDFTKVILPPVDRFYESQIRYSMKLMGFKAPIRATPDREIFEGARRLAIAEKLGITKIPVLIEEVSEVQRQNWIGFQVWRAKDCATSRV